MLERFHVPKEQEVRVTDAALRTTIADIFVACGVPEDDAATGADVLTMTDLRGVETHGVSNMLRAYVGWVRDGQLNPNPQTKVIRETPGTATLDGDRGLGVIQGTAAMQMAIDKAREVGVGVVTMRNSGHLGAVGHFSMQAAQQDMVGICLTAMSTLVLPTFGAIPRLGTNPISIAAPANTEPFLLYDAATSTIAGNKIMLARRVGANMEPGWIADPDGTPIMEERPVPDGLMYGLGAHNLLPLGGTREQGSHKGYGLGLMVEVLATLLSGTVPSMVEEKSPGQSPLRGLQHRSLRRCRPLQGHDGPDAPDADRDATRPRAMNVSSTLVSPKPSPNLSDERTVSHSTARSSTGSTARPTSWELHESRRCEGRIGLGM